MSVKDMSETSLGRDGRLAAAELYDDIRPWVLERLKKKGVSPADLAFIAAQTVEQIARDEGVYNERNGVTFLWKFKAHVSETWVSPREGAHRTKKIEILQRREQYLIGKREGFTDVGTELPSERVPTTYFIYEYDRSEETIYVLHEKVSSTRVRTILNELDVILADIIRQARKKTA